MKNVIYGLLSGLFLLAGQGQAQSINLSSEYDRITWPIVLGVSGGLTGDDGSYKRLALFHGHSISLQTGSNQPGITNSRLYIQSTGEVGIGTTSPETQLHINGSTPILSTGPGSGFKFRNWNAGAVANVDDWEWYAKDNIARFHKVNVGDLLTITNMGNVGIGTDTPGSYRLAVEGKIGAREVEVKTGSWADFVFAPDYRLPALSAVERYIQARQHLPGLPSEAEVKQHGYGLGEMDARLLQKIEELTLYVIEQQKRIERLERKRPHKTGRK